MTRFISLFIVTMFIAVLAGPLAADERRHGRQMIRLERVPHPEKRSEAGAREEVEEGHQR